MQTSPEKPASNADDHKPQSTEQQWTASFTTIAATWCPMHSSPVAYGREHCKKNAKNTVLHNQHPAIPHQVSC
jgi:hypothetical protein